MKDNFQIRLCVFPPKGMEEILHGIAQFPTRKGMVINMNTQEMLKMALDLAGIEKLPLDSSISVEGENITKVLAGIDMGSAEIMIAKQEGYDCVVRHHNMVPMLGKLGELVAESHYEKMVEYGLPANIAQKLVEHRKREIAMTFQGINLDSGPSVARLLNMPYLGIHTPADLLGERAVEEKVKEVYNKNSNPTVKEIFDNIVTLREYDEAPEGQKPMIVVGEDTSFAGKTIVDFAGGLAPELDELKAYIHAGIGTFVCMHMENSIVKSLREDNRCNVICLGHMTSDAIGMNLIFEQWEKHGIEVTRIGGLV